MEITSAEFEKLGVFYMGRQKPWDSPATEGPLLLYDSKDLTTHAVVVGMTGSGKTGLCITLLEEAAMDRIPAIVIDPKGDISNLLLTFPGLTSAEFEPWVDEGQAMRQGQDKAEFAKSEAEKWRRGLARWGQDGERIARMRESVELRVYTPGSTAGRPLTILKSFSAPPPTTRDDSDLFRERIASTAAGLLALLDVDADPIRSREHILISRILENAWKDGRDLDLGRLIGEIQSPPFQRVGIMELDAFFPAKDRTALAMTLNNLLASPSFSSWLEGEPLSVKNMLHNADGKPCISILSIAHLSEAERMFFVTILLEEMIGWMRAQAGTSSLRAILYMDEVFGYFPPVKNPPSKLAMLTLLKQARAYGLGVVLATQNPVDLDYKGLANTGTWFLGRLQTERDKLRVIEGLEGAAAQTGKYFDRGQMETVLSGLAARHFVMNNVHDDAPVLFETRWAMSYLRGPLTRQQLQLLVSENTEAPPATTAAQSNLTQETITAPAESWTSVAAPTSANPELLIPAAVNQRYMEPGRYVAPGERVIYRAALYGHGRARYVKANCGVDTWKEHHLLRLWGGEEQTSEIWERAEKLPERIYTVPQKPDGVAFEEPAKPMQLAKNYKSWEKDLKDFFYRAEPLRIFKCVDLNEYSTAGESQGDFQVRLEVAVSEKRDRETEKMRLRYAPKFQNLRRQIQRAEDRVEREKSQLKQQKLTSILSAGQTILGALLGRKAISATNLGRASSTVRNMGRSSAKQAEVDRIEESVEDLRLRYQELEAELTQAVADLNDKLHVDALTYEEIEIAPRKSDILVEEFGVVWTPWVVDASGNAKPVY